MRLKMKLIVLSNILSEKRLLRKYRKEVKIAKNRLIKQQRKVEKLQKEFKAMKRG